MKSIKLFCPSLIVDHKIREALDINFELKKCKKAELEKEMEVRLFSVTNFLCMPY